MTNNLSDLLQQAGRDNNLNVTTHIHYYSTSKNENNGHIKCIKNPALGGISKDDEDENNVPYCNVDEIIKKYASASSNEELQHCNKLSKKNITTKNFMLFCDLADKYKNLELSLLTEQFITKYFKEVIKEEDFLQLNEEKLGKILSSDNLNVASEADAFDALKKWYNNKGKNDRRIESCRLLENIRYTNLSLKYFSKYVRGELEKYNLYEMKNLISDWHIFPDNRGSYKFIVNPRQYYDETLLQITTDDNLKYVKIEKYNPEEKSWSELRPITPNINYSSAKILDGKLILLGGHDQENKVTSKTWCIDIRTHFEKLEITSMDSKRVFLDAVVMDKRILVFGGIDDDHKEVESVEMWDSLTDEWRKVEQMSQPRYHPTGVFYKGKAYVFGGYHKNAYLKSFEVYDIKENKWTQERIDSKTDIECFDYCHIKSTVLDDDIYVYECFRDCSTYDHHLKRINPSISNTEWYYLPGIPEPQECRYLITHKRKIVFFGSEKNYEYDPEINKWSEFSSQEILDNYNHIFSVPKTTVTPEI